MSRSPKKKSSTDEGKLPGDTSDGAMRTHDVPSVGQKFRRATTSGPLFTNKWKEVSNGFELVFAGDAESECSLSITARGLMSNQKEYPSTYIAISGITKFIFSGRFIHGLFSYWTKLRVTLLVNFLLCSFG